MSVAVLTGCAAGAPTTASPKPSASAPVAPSASLAPTVSVPQATQQASASAPNASPASATLACADIQAAVDAILGPGDGKPVTIGDTGCMFQQSGNELRVIVGDGTSYDDEIATQQLNVSGGTMTGPEAVAGVGDEAVAFAQVGRPGSYLIVHKGAHIVTFAYFDGSGADKADVTKLYDLARSIAAGW